MAQILDSLPPDQSDRVLCCYVNATSKIQIARISNIHTWYFERVVFPGQRLVFEAPPHSVLEIHTGMMASSILSDNIPCERLCVSDDSSFPVQINEEQGNEANEKKSIQRKENLTGAVLTSID